ncbi:MAG: hypothetical protein AABW79_04015 [Nanoarchaeota archaeon]
MIRVFKGASFPEGQIKESRILMTEEKLFRLPELLRPLDVPRVNSIINRFNEINTDVALMGSVVENGDLKYKEIDLLAFTNDFGGDLADKERSILLDYLAVASQFNGVAEISGEYFYPRKVSDRIVSGGCFDGDRVVQYALKPRLSLSESFEKFALFALGASKDPSYFPAVINLSFGSSR